MANVRIETACGKDAGFCAVRRVSMCVALLFEKDRCGCMFGSQLAEDECMYSVTSAPRYITAAADAHGRRS